MFPWRHPRQAYPFSKTLNVITLSCKNLCLPRSRRLDLVQDVISWQRDFSLVSEQTQNIDDKTKTLNVITLRRWQGGLGGPARPVKPIVHRQRAQALLLPWALSVQAITRLPHRYHVVCSIRLWGMCNAFRRGISWRTVDGMISVRYSREKTRFAIPFA